LTKKQGKDGGKLKIRSTKESCIKRRNRKRGERREFGWKKKCKKERGRRKQLKIVIQVHELL